MHKSVPYDLTVKYIYQRIRNYNKLFFFDNSFNTIGYKL